MSGLEQHRLQQSYPEIRRFLLATRSAYLNMVSPGQERPLMVMDGLNILALMQYLPSYLVHRAENPVAISGALPRHIVVGANSASGGMGALGAYAQGNIILPLPKGEVALHAIEQEGSLVGEKTVCAASPVMIMNFLDILREGSDKIEFSDVETETKGLLATSELRNAVAFGTQMETLYPLHELLKEADARCAAQLSAYNPRKHNERRGRQAMEGLKVELRPILIQFQQISNQVSFYLGREDSERDDLLTAYATNQAPLASLVIARKKGVRVDFSDLI